MTRMCVGVGSLGLAALLVAAGCSKNEVPAGTPAERPPEAAQQPVPAPLPPPLTNVPVQPPLPRATSNTTSVAATTNTATDLAASLQHVLRSQEIAIAQAATNQLRALAAAATNRIVSALTLTNQATPVGTNQPGAAALSQVETLLQQAKVLSSNQKYQEALNTIAQLYQTQLTPEQRQQVDSLKAQIQTTLAQKAAAGASSALNGFLGGKK